MVLPRVFWEPYSNSAFPDWVLIMHWGAVFFASNGFIYGYLKRWRKTPYIMAYAYGLMALVCLVETVGFLTNSTKYIAMGVEYILYILILLMLFRSTYFVDYFDR